MLIVTKQAQLLIIHPEEGWSQKALYALRWAQRAQFKRRMGPSREEAELCYVQGRLALTRIVIYIQQSHRQPKRNFRV